MKIYLCIKCYGSYDDYFESIICGYENKDKANEFIEKYNNELEKICGKDGVIWM